MAITLKEESILNQWSQMVDHGGGNSNDVMCAICDKLHEAQIPGECTWNVEEVKSSGFLSKTRREFLIVSLEDFRDYHIYVCIRDYGIHLHCSWFLTVEPGYLKKWASEKLTGFADLLSAPKNIMVHQDLQAWVTVVDSAVAESVHDLMAKLGQDTSRLHRGSRGFLEIW
ncbi:MAG: hypothetical protein WAU88_15525 [Candidatus Zixiibacteriota bacterium]